MGVPPGSRTTRTTNGRSRRRWARSWIWVDFPPPSVPSNVMNSPLTEATQSGTRRRRQRPFLSLRLVGLRPRRQDNRAVRDVGGREENGRLRLGDLKRLQAVIGQRQNLLVRE